MYENTNDKCKSLPKVNQEQKKATLSFKTSQGETIELNKRNSSNTNQLGPKVEPAKTKKLSWSFKHEDPRPTTNQDKRESIQSSIPVKTQIEKELTLALIKFTSNNIREIFNYFSF